MSIYMDGDNLKKGHAIVTVVGPTMVLKYEEPGVRLGWQVEEPGLSAMTTGV